MKTLKEQTNSTTIYYCCDGSDLLACNAGGYYDQYIDENNIIELDMYTPASGSNPMNIIYSMAFPPGGPTGTPWTSIEDYQDWCNDPMMQNQSGQVGAWCDVVVDSVKSYPKGCGGTGVNTFGDTVSMKPDNLNTRGGKDDIEKLKIKGRRRSQSHGYGCDCGDGNYDKSCCDSTITEEQCGPGMYWCKTSQECKPMNKNKRKKEQTTSGAAGAYSQPLFGEPKRGKINEAKKCKIGKPCDGGDGRGNGTWTWLFNKCVCSYGGMTPAGTNDWEKSVVNDFTNASDKNKRKPVRIKESELISLIEKSIYSAKHGGVIKEALTDADEKRIGVIARKELKDYEKKLEKKIEQLITKAFKGKDFEDRTLKIARNAIVQLYKALWIRRSFWTNYIKNTPS